MLAGLAGTAAALTGCGTGARKEVVRFWAFGREGEATAELLRDFHARNPDVEVEIQRLPWISAHEKLLTAYAGETLPDVCQLGKTWVPEFAALDALEPIDDYVSSSHIVRPDDFFAGTFNANRVDETLYGIPWYVDTRLLYYRTDLLQQAGFNSPPTKPGTKRPPSPFKPMPRTMPPLSPQRPAICRAGRAPWSQSCGHRPRGRRWTSEVRCSAPRILRTPFKRSSRVPAGPAATRWRFLSAEPVTARRMPSRTRMRSRRSSP